MSARVQPRAAPLLRGGLSQSRIRCSSSVSTPSAAAARASASESRPKRTAAGVERRPEVLRRGPDGAERAIESCTGVAGEVARALDLEHHEVGQALGEELAGRGVADAAGDQPVELVLHLVGRDAPTAGAARDDECVVGVATLRHTVARRTSAIRASPLRTATSVESSPRTGRGRGGCVDGGVAAPHLPSEGRTAPMWSRKARLGPTTRTLGPVQAPAEGVEQPRRPVQADGGSLPVPGAPCTQMLVARSERTISTCWAGSSRRCRASGGEGRSISAARMPLRSAASPATSRSSSYAVRRPRSTPNPPQLDAHRLGGEAR